MDGRVFSALSEVRVRELLAAVNGRRVLVVGDLMLDGHLHGRVGRISPEAPVPVFEVQGEDRRLGGAANVARGLTALGIKPLLGGLIGADEAGRELVEKARSLEIDTAAVVEDQGRPTTRKTRIVSRGQQILRVDRESAKPAEPKIEAELLTRLRSAMAEAEVLVFSDYGKGVFTRKVCRELTVAARERRVPVLVDPTGTEWELYTGATLIKPNLGEAEHFCGFNIRGDDEAEAAMRRIGRRTGVSHVLLTRGEEGMALLAMKEGARPLFFNARGRTVYDVTGAGDTAVGVLAALWAAGATPEEATWTANLAAGIAVGKQGATVVSGFEILEELAEQPPSFEGKLLGVEQAAEHAAEIRRRGGKVVFTNGCFDLLHLGHVSYLERARLEGDALFVGVNNDASIRRLKGPGRPVVGETDRARVLGALSCVDGVVLFGEDTPHRLLEALRPDVLCKGGNYARKEEIVGWELVESWGGKAVLLPLVEGRSTSALIRTARAREVEPTEDKSPLPGREK